MQVKFGGFVHRTKILARFPLSIENKISDWEREPGEPVWVREYKGREGQDLYDYLN